MPRARKRSSEGATDQAQATDAGTSNAAMQSARVSPSGTVRTGFVRLSDEQIASMSGAQLRAVGQQRGYDMGPGENPAVLRGIFSAKQSEDQNLDSPEDLGLTVHPRSKAFVSGASAAASPGLGNVVGGGSRLTGRTQDAAYLGPTRATEPHSGKGEPQPLRGDEVEEATDDSYTGANRASVEDSRAEADAVTGIEGGAPKQVSVETAPGE